MGSSGFCALNYIKSKRKITCSNAETGLKATGHTLFALLLLAIRYQTGTY
jgi:hypothetical protein